MSHFFMQGVQSKNAVGADVVVICVIIIFTLLPCDCVLNLSVLDCTSFVLILFQNMHLLLRSSIFIIKKNYLFVC